VQADDGYEDDDELAFQPVGRHTDSHTKRAGLGSSPINGGSSGFKSRPRLCLKSLKSSAKFFCLTTRNFQDKKFPHPSLCSLTWTMPMLGTIAWQNGTICVLAHIAKTTFTLEWLLCKNLPFSFSRQVGDYRHYLPLLPSLRTNSHLHVFI